MQIDLECPTGGHFSSTLPVVPKLVFRKIQTVFGGRMRYMISGAAPLNKDIAEFFHACGVLILEGIGMTENTSFSNVNTREDNRFGTVGRTGPGARHPRSTFLFASLALRISTACST